MLEEAAQAFSSLYSKFLKQEDNKVPHNQMRPSDSESSPREHDSPENVDEARARVVALADTQEEFERDVGEGATLSNRRSPT